MRGRAKSALAFGMHDHHDCRTQQPECDPTLFPVVLTLVCKREGRTCQDPVRPPLLSLVGGLQEVPEDPLGHGPALCPALFIREAEMDALVDADIDRIPGQIREAVIRARVWVSQWILADDREGHLVRPEVSSSMRVNAPTTLLAPEV